MKETIAQFREFVRRADEMLALQHEPPVQEFRHFIQASLPMVMGDLRKSLECCAATLNGMRSWLTPYDLLRIARIEYIEDAYTELMAWALAPTTHQSSALQRQRAWLRHLRIPEEISSPAEPISQLSTGDGVPDLVLQFPTFAVVIEAKTGSDEHPTPSGELQTFAYPNAVREKLQLESCHQVYIVFLTPEKRKAANPDAILATYCEFAVVLAGALSHLELPADLRFAFQTVISHLATCGLPYSLPRSFLADTIKWLDTRDDLFLLNNLSHVKVLAEIIPGAVV
jgi:hypothetical protein